MAMATAPAPQWNVSDIWARLRAWLPEGRELPAEDWGRRHDAILIFIAANAVGLAAFGVWRGWALPFAFGEPAFIAAIGALAAWPRLGRRFRSSAAALACVVSSAVLTQFWGGVIEGHFHFFVVVALIALYQDWVPFLLAILFVAVDHGVMGTLAPQWVYNHPAALAHPWRWATIHATLVLAQCSVLVVAWKATEKQRAATDAAVDDLKGTLSVLGATLESTADGILVVDSRGKIASANKKFARMWNIPEEALATRNDDDAIRTVIGQLENPEVFLQKVRELYADTEAESFDVLHFKDGRVFERYSQPHRIGGVAVGRVWSFRDVTDRVRADAERKESEEKLREFERLKAVDEFRKHLLSAVSHELKTPLTPLRMQVDMLNKEFFGPLNERQKRSVDILGRNLVRLSSLVQQTLEVSRLQTGNMQLDRQPMTLQSVVHEASEAYEEAAREKKIEVTVDGEDVQLEADAQRLAQVLFNLMSNAMKFTPSGGGVHIETSLEDGDAIVRVADTGPGIKAEDMHKLFQPFSQLTTQPGDPNAGTGLGLYISRGIIEAHGGRIWVESDGPGTGTTFVFKVPVRKGDG